MLIIELAGVRIRIENKYPFVEQQCRDYLAEGEDFSFSVAVSDEEIALEKGNGAFSEGYCESICVYRHICEELPRYRVFLMHSSILEVDGYAYAFAAKSGVGKSTHTALWLKNIPNARVLNGDKPLLRLEEDGSLTAFGTPWNGKENWGENRSAPLAAICFLERGEVNGIRTATEDEVLSRLVHQLYLRGDRDSVILRLQLLDAMLKAVPFYVLHCNISDEAALVAYRAMKKD
ncbi:MAG: hypothetical protein IKB75_02195 [Clostridia bacterium]|nr:hypothetical protein [Clostridia bacterium]